MKGRAIAAAAVVCLGAAVPAIAQRSPFPPQFVVVGWTASHGYLGVNFRDLTDEQLGALPQRETRGVEITQVDHDGPACKAGLREHDVLLQLSGQLIEGADQLRRTLREIPAGRSVTLVFVRDGQQQSVTFQLANREALERQAWDQHIPVPEPPAGAAASARPDRSGSSEAGGLSFLGGRAPSAAALGPRTADRNLIGTVLPPSFTGAALETLGPQLAEYFGAVDGNGLLVRSIEVNSPAATAGLKAGDVVVRVNQVAVITGADWLRLMHESKGRPVGVTILREKKEQTLTLTPDAKRRSALKLPPTQLPQTVSLLQWPRVG